MTFTFSQTTALVTGASSGIGNALAVALAARGVNLIVTARRKDRLDALAERLGAQVNVVALEADLSCQDGVDDLIAAVQGLPMTVDVLVNCAGIAPHGSFLQTSDVVQQALVQLNVMTPTRLIRHFLPLMQSRGFGRILNVCSVAGFHAVPGMAQYGATKAYLLSLTEALSEEIKGSGVAASALCPGVTRTESVIQAAVEALPEAMVLDPEAVANAGLDALAKGEVVCIPGRLNQAAVTAAQFQPRWLMRSVGGLLAKLGS